MADKILKTRLQLKYDTLSAWSLIENSFVPYAGEVCVVSVPQGQDELSLQEKQPAILFKVGDGKTTFKQLPWASGLAADVFGWAKESSLTVTKNGTGNVVASISWDATLNNGKGGIKYETAAVATAEGLDQIQKDLAALTATVNGMYTKAQIDEAIAAAKSGAETTAANALSAARTEISKEIDDDVKVVADDLAGYKTTANAALADRYTKGEADAKFALITDAYDDTVLAGRVSTLETNSATKTELNNVDAKFAGYNTTAVQKGIDDAQDARIKAIEDTYLDADDIANFETKENVKKVADDLAGYVESNNEALAGVKATADKAAEDIAALGNTYATITELNKTNEAVTNLQTNSATKTELTDGLATKADKTAFEAIETKVNNFFAEDAAVNDVIDTLVEITNYIANDKEGAADISSRLGNLEGKVDVAKVSEAIAAAVKGEADRATEAEGNLEDRIEVIENAGYATTREVATAKSEAIAAAATDAATKASNAETNAKSYADSLADNYATAAQGALADTALQEVKAAADGGLKVTNKNEIAINDSVTFILYGGSASELIENAPQQA